MAKVAAERRWIGGDMQTATANELRLTHSQCQGTNADSETSQRGLRSYRRSRHNVQFLVYQGKRPARARQGGEMGLGNLRRLSPGARAGDRARAAHRNGVARQ